MNDESKFLIVMIVIFLVGFAIGVGFGMTILSASADIPSFNLFEEDDEFCVEAKITYLNDDITWQTICVYPKGDET